MADGDPPVPRRTAEENELDEMFDLEKFVMSMASELPYFWPQYNAEMTQNVLQSSDIEDGTYILRPTSGRDKEKRKFLTLSVRMTFPAEPTKVWHFPVNVTLVENGGSIPTVYFSVAQTSSPTGSQITSLNGLLEYHHTRPLKGDKLPDMCLVTKGLEYHAHWDGSFSRMRVRDRNERMNGGIGAYEMNVIDVSSGSPPQAETPSELLKPAPVVPSRSRSSPGPSTDTLGSPKLPPRASSPTPVPSPRNYSTLPRNPKSSSTTPSTFSHCTNTLPNPSRKPPTPAPRRPTVESADSLAPQRPARLISRDTNSRKSDSSSKSDSSLSSGDSIEEDLCPCGIPTRYSNLPKSWTVHRSSARDTKDMLYFMNHLGQTAWALPPDVDRLCPHRDYLRYGKLNRSCFEQYHSDLTYSPGSQLSDWQNYLKYGDASEGRAHI